MPRKRKWTDEQLRSAVETSRSVSQVLEKLGLGKTGGNYENIGFHIKRLELDTSDFLGQGWNKGLKHNPSPPMTDEEWFVKDSQRNRGRTKTRLARLGVANSCSICEIESWLDKKLTLQLDHINGDRHDNRLSNLRLLCPNCHSQTKTYSGRNRRT